MERRNEIGIPNDVPEWCTSDLDPLCAAPDNLGPEGRVVSMVLSAPKGREALFAEIERVSSTGGYCWHPATGRILGTAGVYRVLELDPAVPLTVTLISARIHSQDAVLFDEIIRRTNALEGDFEYQLRLRTEPVKYMLLSARRSDTADHRTFYVGAIQDVTGRRQLEAALGDVHCELARFARASRLGADSASIAHEINQPLSGILTNANTCLGLLGLSPPDLHAVRAAARRIVRDGERASEVISRLRALFEKRSSKSDAVDLNGTAREAIALSLSDLQQRRVTIRMELAEYLPLVTGDRVQLQQVILNLLLNAAEAMSPIEDGPRQLLMCTDSKVANQVRLSVQDSGVGFEPHDLQRLFEPFFTTKTGGMGIGLSVSRSIIESHGGRLWAEHNTGPGATFTFSLPARENSAQ
jgi:C4-dicarboxylate-specific signal transduction histidine kinase